MPSYREIAARLNSAGILPELSVIDPRRNGCAEFGAQNRDLRRIRRLRD